MDEAGGLSGPDAMAESNQVANATTPRASERDAAGTSGVKGPGKRFRRVPEARYADDRLGRRMDTNHMLRVRRGEREREREWVR